MDMYKKYSLWVPDRGSNHVPQPGIEQGTPGSVTKRHDHEVKSSGPVTGQLCALYIYKHIDYLYFALPYYYTHTDRISMNIRLILLR